MSFERQFRRVRRRSARLHRFELLTIFGAGGHTQKATRGPRGLMALQPPRPAHPPPAVFLRCRHMAGIFLRGVYFLDFCTNAPDAVEVTIGS